MKYKMEIQWRNKRRMIFEKKQHKIQQKIEMIIKTQQTEPHVIVCVGVCVCLYVFLVESYEPRLLALTWAQRHMWWFPNCFAI